jgi:hypothetical protein
MLSGICSSGLLCVAVGISTAGHALSVARWGTVVQGSYYGVCEWYEPRLSRPQTRGQTLNPHLHYYRSPYPETVGMEFKLPTGEWVYYRVDQRLADWLTSR